MTDLRRRFSIFVMLSALTAGSALGIPEVAAAHPSKLAITTAMAGAGAAHHTPRLKRLRRRGERRL